MGALGWEHGAFPQVDLSAGYPEPERSPRKLATESCPSSLGPSQAQRWWFGDMVMV